MYSDSILLLCICMVYKKTEYLQVEAAVINWQSPRWLASLRRCRPVCKRAYKPEVSVIHLFPLPLFLPLHILARFSFSHTFKCSLRASQTSLPATSTSLHHRGFPIPVFRFDNVSFSGDFEWR
ncbi:uncharacterized protein LACBIDRAFT_297582 [Laccaria bicolor S238N-H82]|uniref:Predicted protein n=1 Tax=Laccaria bicolor (strain S238N-H82 / ATCC MYA-4686) TaxID=486041 RepID=B0DBI8_LACBS|nr:uncharacterized protein LACBIDRAFT_297582 [Laccaria bicolor S238N-H82]EDR08194.1 predicted protein [Laccaria bicolor S238N-H82]|eukprot:XP_001881264.1 predicted protein [Laccaria bicolor S238N-H82]